MVYSSNRESKRKNELKKCMRKGDIIHYSNPENIHMVKSGETLTPSSTGTVDVDKISSGESLYKTFTFEQSANDEETEKCIAFWKGVVEKNLQHIKCAFIENKNKNSSIHVPKEPIEETFTNEEVEAKIRKVHEDYTKMWQNALKEVQRKKLHEIKLIGTERCKLCESVSTDVDEGACKPDKKEIKKEIKDLDKWTSKRQPLKKAAVSTATVQKDACEREMTTWASLTKRPEECAPPKDPKTYTFKNIIEEKKKNGDYSAWRTNKLVCNCGNPDCRCALNPAVTSFEPMEGVKDGLCTLGSTDIPDAETEGLVDELPVSERTETDEDTADLMDEFPLTPAPSTTVSPCPSKTTTPEPYSDPRPWRSSTAPPQSEVTLTPYDQSGQSVAVEKSQTEYPSPWKHSDSSKFIYDGSNAVPPVSEMNTATNTISDPITGQLNDSDPSTAWQHSDSSKFLFNDPQHSADTVYSQIPAAIQSLLDKENATKKNGPRKSILKSHVGTSKSVEVDFQSKDEFLPTYSELNLDKERSRSAGESRSKIYMAASAASSIMSGEPPSVMEILSKIKGMKKSISMAVKNCDCIHTDCDCYDIHTTGRTDDHEPDEDSLLPLQESRVSSMRFPPRRDSIIIHRRSISTKRSKDNLTMDEKLKILYSKAH